MSPAVEHRFLLLTDAEWWEEQRGESNEEQGGESQGGEPQGGESQGGESFDEETARELDANLRDLLPQAFDIEPVSGSRLAGLHEKRGASVWPVNLIDLSHGKAWSLVLDAALAVVTARKVLRDLRAGG